MELIPLETIFTSSWSGGVTHQITIFPHDSSLSKQDFMYRVSSAEVALDESDFTFFRGYTRFLVSLNNPIHISHNRGGIIALEPLQVHRFSGDVETKSYGMCSDFNLILKDTLVGSVGTLRHDLQEISEGHTVIYAYQDRVLLEINGESRIIEKHKALLIKSKEPIKVGLLSSSAIYANIQIEI